MKRIGTNPCLALLLLITVFLLSACSSQPAAETGVVTGKLAPQFTLNDLEGKAVKLEPGKVTVINFWATWCPPCKAEMPELQKFVNEHKDIAFYAVNIQDPVENARSFMQKNDYHFTVLLDEKGAVAQTFQVQAIPTTLILDKKVSSNSARRGR